MSDSQKVEETLGKLNLDDTTNKKSWADIEEASPTTTTNTTNNNNNFVEQFVAATGVGLDEQQSDPNNPLFSEVQKFEDLGLKDPLLQGVHALKYNKPSRIQARALPILLKEKVNLIAQSQSGTGKTATFGLGVLQHINEAENAVQAIMVAPTLELADQITNVIIKLSRFTGIKVRSLLKGEQIKARITDHIIVGTPGKMSDMIKKRFIDTRKVAMYVIDEADQMLDEGNRIMLDQCKIIKQNLPSTARVYLFSATYGEDEMLTGDEAEKQKQKEEKVFEFAKSVVPEPYKMILVPKEELTLSNMKQFYVETDSDNGKESVLKDIFEELTVGQSIIFMNRKDAATRLCNNMRQDGFKVSMLHSEMDPEDRKKTINDFKLGNTRVLISTNVLARGLDIPTVTHVINYDLPIVFERRGGPRFARGGFQPANQNGAPQADYATYLHRIGRTARFGRSGFAINLCAGPADLDIVKQLDNYFKITITKVDKDDIADKIK